MRLAHEGAEVAQRAVVGVDLGVGRDVVAVVAQRAGVEGQQPDGGHAEVGDVVELLRSGPRSRPCRRPCESYERLDVELVDDRVLVPERVVARASWCGAGPICHGRSPQRSWRSIGQDGFSGADGEDAERVPGRVEVDRQVGAALARAAPGEQVGEPVRLVPADADRRQVRDGGSRRSAVVGSRVHRHVDRVAPAIRVAGERVDLAMRHRLAVEERPLAGDGSKRRLS